MIMPHYLRIGEKKLSRIRLTIHPGATVTEVFSLLRKVEIVGLPHSPQTIIYAVLELVSNSLRALSKKVDPAPVYVTLAFKDGSFTAEVRDEAGGFDPSTLPYDINLPVDRIDIESKAFHAYREANGNRHFGLGLYIAKKVFDRLEIHFFDGTGNEVPWDAQEKHGTLIRGSIAIGAPHGAERRKAESTSR